MKALILAGGFGTRLRPLSCTRPKHLFPIANKPLLDLTLERLASNNINEVILAVNFMAKALEQAFGKRRHGMTIHYSRDMPPGSKDKRSIQGGLGTGGPVKQAEKLLGLEDPFFVLNGDILTDAKYSEIMEAHKSHGGISSIAVHRVANPGRFGVIEQTREKRITGFVEKPSENTTSSNLINAGIYVFNPEIFEYIPAGNRCSIEREIFPQLAQEGQLFGHEIEGLWVDVGKPEDFIKANRLWLEAGMEDQQLSAETSVENGVQFKEAVALGRDVTIGKDAIVGPNVALGKDTFVGKGVQIKDSIVFPNTTILDFTTIEGAIIGESATVGKGVQIRKGCLIGDNVIIQDNITLTQNVKICPSKKISESIRTPKCAM